MTASIWRWMVHKFFLAHGHGHSRWIEEVYLSPSEKIATTRLRLFFRETIKFLRARRGKEFTRIEAEKLQTFFPLLSTQLPLFLFLISARGQIYEGRWAVRGTLLFIYASEEAGQFYSIFSLQLGRCRIMLPDNMKNPYRLLIFCDPDDDSD